MLPSDFFIVIVAVALYVCIGSDSADLIHGKEIKLSRRHLSGAIRFLRSPILITETRFIVYMTVKK